MKHREMRENAQRKAENATQVACYAAIVDCHETLRVGQYSETDPYAIKLWCEIDAYRDRLLYLSRK